jgi:hypothetical protein
LVVLFKNDVLRSDLITKINSIITTMHEMREKNYLVEKKVILKIKEIFSKENNEN